VQRRRRRKKNGWHQPWSLVVVAITRIHHSVIVLYWTQTNTCKRKREKREGEWEKGISYIVLFR